MCGISGYISTRDLIADDGISRTLKLMKRRGPDAKNFYKISENFKLISESFNLRKLPSRAKNYPKIDRKFTI